MNDFDLALLAADSYASNPRGIIIHDDDMRVAINDDLVTISTTPPTDLQSWLIGATPVTSEVGECHDDLLRKARRLFPLIKLALDDLNYTLIGHSTGGGIAILVAALMTRAYHPPDRLLTFGAPKVGDAMLKKIFIGTPVTQYRYGNDPITEMASDRYEHLRKLTSVGLPMLIPMHCHSIMRMIDGLKLYYNQPMAGSPA